MISNQTPYGIFDLARVSVEQDWTFHVDGTKPPGTEVFVFGSNLAGIHGAGAAALALIEYGAISFKNYGHMGNCFAIPTKQRNYKYRLTLPEIKAYVDKFCAYTRKRHDLKFFVTGIGCGYSGYTPQQIAPMFKEAINCSFPDGWAIHLLN